MKRRLRDKRPFNYEIHNDHECKHELWTVDSAEWNHHTNSSIKLRNAKKNEKKEPTSNSKPYWQEAILHRIRNIGNNN